MQADSIISRTEFAIVEISGENEDAYFTDGASVNSSDCAFDFLLFIPQERDYEGGTAGCRNHIAFAGWPEPVHLGFQNEFHSLFQEWVRIITITTLMTDEEILQGL
ncbi:hypothetical protein GH714_023106 [Hevea brasiliensis]|uniref:Uncharacterized protein n=1 Tax=Hevea brasiliensis TaxID=3981 RepID=A0A6A6N6A7_HEVBR|nr:hypothetical protein GH714_023106 [Hevea brasiliensis]